jgi:hypothetical protein
VERRTKADRICFGCDVILVDENSAPVQSSVLLVKVEVDWSVFSGQDK